MIFIKIILSPLSFLYGIGVGIRNFLFNTGILKSKEFNIPVICVGNITVGGTGKTPHTEYLLSRLQNDFRVACLSRGYKRQTSGFQLATLHSNAEEIGDEPLQIKHKFPKVIVAVDENRVRGIEHLLALPERPEVIILDDAFQHRSVKAGKNIVLVDYNRPVFKDCLLPAGRLRETPKGLKRADYIIVSKCPPTLTPIEKRILFKHLKIKPYQQLFFTHQQYGPIRDINTQETPLHLDKNSYILCLTGIANPTPYIEHLKKFTPQIKELRYPDHHHFTSRDISEICTSFENIPYRDKYLFTTEKDLMRLKSWDLPENLKKKIFYIPVEPVFLNKQDVLLNELKDYVTKNK